LAAFRERQKLESKLLISQTTPAPYKGGPLQEIFALIEGKKSSTDQR
jgi:hypothetical protein